MLATLAQLPSNVWYLTRRTTSLSVMVAAEVSAAVFPSLLMPRDRIAWEAWATGYLADNPQPLIDAPRARALRTS